VVEFDLVTQTLLQYSTTPSSTKIISQFKATYVCFIYPGSCDAAVAFNSENKLGLRSQLSTIRGLAPLQGHVTRSPAPTDLGIRNQLMRRCTPYNLGIAADYGHPGQSRVGAQRLSEPFPTQRYLARPAT
jgi:hypothetical protein